MRPDSALMPPKVDTRMSCADAVSHPTFTLTVLALFEKGYDTKDIALALFEHEYVVAFALRLARERRAELASRAERAQRGPI